MPDGSILVTDDTNNIIYRIAYNSKQTPSIMSRDNISTLLPETASASGQITIQSPSFTNMGMIPDKHSNYYEGVSPALSWSNVPQNAKSLVLMLEDPDANVKPVTHWIMANLPSNTTSLPENLMKTEMANGGAMQGANVTGKIGYYGPKPPRDDPPHNYHFQIFALDTMLNLPSGFNRQALLDAMKNHVIAKGEIVGMYQRRPDNRQKQEVVPPKGK
jgi:Raf kinase inhibitor-like YbhB/YbcL family protein